MAIRGLISVGELAAFAALLTVLLPVLRSMGWMFSVLARGRASLERIFELLDAPIDRPEGEVGRLSAPGAGPALTLSRLSFAYPDDPGRMVLRDITVELPAGAVIGLFGRTGSGKSTLLRVLARLYDPPPASVFVDGVDLAEMDLAAWRRRLTMVPQRPFLFSDSIASNIAMGVASPEIAVMAAVEAAALEPDLGVLPDGLDTVVGERGIMLSGGQRQRVALARGLYRGGDLLILDDVLSAVDHTTEKMLVDTLSDLSRSGNRPTVLVASNRLSVLRRTDLVLVLDKGRLVAEGHHDELVGRPGIYRDTWLAQKAGAILEDEAAS